VKRSAIQDSWSDQNTSFEPVFAVAWLAQKAQEHALTRTRGWCDGIRIAAAVRGGRAGIDSVIFHTDRGSTYTADSSTVETNSGSGSRWTGRLVLRQRRRRVVFPPSSTKFSPCTTKTEARSMVLPWCHEFYNTR